MPIKRWSSKQEFLELRGYDQEIGSLLLMVLGDIIYSLMFKSKFYVFIFTCVFPSNQTPENHPQPASILYIEDISLHVL